MVAKLVGIKKTTVHTPRRRSEVGEYEKGRGKASILKHKTAKK